MNSISLTSYSLKMKDYARLYSVLENNGFEIIGLSSPGIVKDQKEKGPDYAMILNHKKIILFDERSEQDPRYRARHADLKGLLEEF